MDLQIAKEITGGLSFTSKMPGASYSLPAHACITGSNLRKSANSVCSKCYARKGRYLFGNVKKCLDKRLESLKNPEWVSAITTLIEEEARKSSDVYCFRWHDSGDLQGLWHLQNICKVAKALPEVRFWLPTKETQLLRKFLKTSKLPDNLLVRLSNPIIDLVSPFTSDLKDIPRSIVLSKDKRADFEKQWNVCVCPAPEQDGKCFDCRACWMKEVSTVAYILH